MTTREYTRNRDLSILFSSFVALHGLCTNFCARQTNSRIQEDPTLPLSAKNVRSPKQMENARFFAESGRAGSSCILLFVWRAQKLVHNPCNATKLEKRIDKSLFRVYSRVVKWIHHHRLDIKILKRRYRDFRNSKVPGRSFQNEKGL